MTQFLERKFRVSRSLSTKNNYNSAIQKFIKFLEVQHDFGLLEILKEIESKNTDPVDVLDDFYSFLTQYKRENSEKIGYSKPYNMRLYHSDKGVSEWGKLDFL